MKLEILLALVLVTTVCSAHSVPKREVETEVAEATNEEEPALAPPQSARRQLPADLPNPNPHGPMLEDGKRGLDVPFGRMQVCTGWIEDFFKKALILGGEEVNGRIRDAQFSDLQRIFILMDNDGDFKISTEEFVPTWMTMTGFNEADAMGLFKIFFTRVGDMSDENHITPLNIAGIWEDLFGTDIEGGQLSKESFTATWANIILPALHFHGCPVVPDPNTDGELPVATGEDARVRPDVYGYYKRRK